jgi:hypothetical protein
MDHVGRYSLFEVWEFGHSVREIERSSQRVVVEETAIKGGVLLFGLFALAVMVVFRSAGGAALGLVFISFAIYSGVRSLFIADRTRKALTVRRQIGWWHFEKTYDSERIDRICVLSTGKGSGLEIRFKSGERKHITMSLNSTANLNSLAGALNHFLPRRQKLI